MSFFFESEGEFPVSKIAQSSAIFMNDIIITRAKLTADVATQDDDTIIFYLGTSDTESGTYTFEQVTNGVNHYFAVTKKWLKWKARLTGYSGNQTHFSNLKVYINQ